MSKPFFKKLFLNSYESLDTENEKYKDGNCLKENVYYYSGEESEEEKNEDVEDPLLIVKLQIVQSRLNLMAESIKRNLDVVLISFLDKLQLRAEMVRLFNKDDNYLYLLPKIKLHSFKNIYAYRRLLYVIRSFKYRRTVLSGCFYKWRDSVVKDDGRLTRNSAMNSLFKTIEKLVIYNTHVKYLMFSTWRNIIDENAQGLSRLYKGLLRIRKVFFKRKSSFFEIFIGKFNNTTHLGKIVYFRLRILLLKDMFKKCFIKWRLFIKDKWGFKPVVRGKNNEGHIFTIIDKIFKTKNNLLLKRIFFEALINKIKNQNTLKEYGKKYLKIPIIVDDFKRVYISLIRNVFGKLFTLKKTFFMFCNKKQKLLTKDANWLQSNFIICFSKWKKFVIEDIKKPLLDEIILHKFTNLIMKRINTYSLIFLQKLKSLDKFWLNKQKVLNLKLSLFIMIIKKVSTKIPFNKLIKIEENKLSHKRSILKLVVYYKRFNQRMIDKSTLRFWFNKWKPGKALPINSLGHLKDLSIYSKLTAVLYKKYIRAVRPLFRVFLMRTIKKKVYIKSGNVNQIDHLIIRNQNQILVQLEKEEKKLDSEINISKQMLSEKSKLQVIIKNIYRKHFYSLYKCFSLWTRFTDVAKKDVHILDSYDNIINEGDNIRIIHDNLVNLYEEKKTNYQKILEDYEVFKKNFCVRCVQDDKFLVSYKSISHLNLNTLCDVEPNEDHKSSSEDTSEASNI
jgi:hypothetical protein